jgi:hypothetical protein
VAVRQLRPRGKSDRAVYEREHRNGEQRRRHEHRAPVRAREDRDRDCERRRGAECGGDRARLEKRDGGERPVAVRERRLEDRDHERARDAEHARGRKRHRERAADGEEERAGGDTGRREPERPATAEPKDDAIAREADGDRPDRVQRGVQADDGARDVELLAQRGERGPERVEHEAPEAEHPVAETGELVSLEPDDAAQSSSPGRSENMTESRRRPSG